MTLNHKKTRIGIISLLEIMTEGVLKRRYFYPVGWKGYALKVVGKYDNGNDNWLLMDNNSEEWYVMFHGTHKDFCKNIVKDGLK